MTPFKWWTWRCVWFQPAPATACRWKPSALMMLAWTVPTTALANAGMGKWPAREAQTRMVRLLFRSCFTLPSLFGLAGCAHPDICQSVTIMGWSGQDCERMGCEVQCGADEQLCEVGYDVDGNFFWYPLSKFYLLMYHLPMHRLPSAQGMQAHEDYLHGHGNHDRYGVSIWE